MTPKNLRASGGWTSGFFSPATTCKLTDMLTHYPSYRGDKLSRFAPPSELIELHSPCRIRSLAKLVEIRYRRDLFERWQGLDQGSPGFRIPVLIASFVTV